MITIDEHFEVPCSPAEVWNVISDPRSVVECISGATLGEYHEDGTFSASLIASFGALRVKFTNRIELELDAGALEGRVTARGGDSQGGARVKTNALFRVADRGSSGSLLTIVGQVELSGKLASAIETGAAVVVRRLAREFSENLRARCLPELIDEQELLRAAPAIHGARLSLRSLYAWMRRERHHDSGRRDVHT